MTGRSAMKVYPGDQAVAAAYVESGGNRRVVAAATGTFVQHVDRALRKPHVVAEIARLEFERLITDGVPAAVNCLIEIATNKRAPAGARVQASKVIMDRAFAAEDAVGDRQPHEMTSAELIDRIAQFERRALAAKNITPEPESQVVDVDPFG